MVLHQFGDNDEEASNGASSGDHPRDLRNPMPFPIVRYMKQYSGKLYGRRRSAKRLVGDLHEIKDARSGRLRDSTVGAWIKR